MQAEDFSLLLFSVDPVLVREATEAGIGHFIVDWEHLGKEGRQAGADTEINHYSAEDLRRVRAATSAHVLCRINQFHEGTAAEIETAVEAGADELMLPMVRNAGEVGRVLEMLRGRSDLGILIETVEAVEAARDLARLPLSRIYIGLNDLAIERGTPNIFTALIDGTVDRVREHVNLPFGFGGLTLPEAGFPIPCRLLIAEMARLDCGFSFLRRSFLRDIRGRILSEEVPRIRQAIELARRRGQSQIEENRKSLIRAVANWNAAECHHLEMPGHA
jgi:hypothetical protein